MTQDPGVGRTLGDRYELVAVIGRGGMAEVWEARDTRLGRMRVPRRFRAHVDVIADPPFDPPSASAEVLEAKVRELRGSAA